jgi:hypothetical protein
MITEFGKSTTGKKMEKRRRYVAQPIDETGFIYTFPA